MTLDDRLRDEIAQAIKSGADAWANSDDPQDTEECDRYSADAVLALLKARLPTPLTDDEIEDVARQRSLAPFARAHYVGGAKWARTRLSPPASEETKP